MKPAWNKLKISSIIATSAGIGLFSKAAAQRFLSHQFMNASGLPAKFAQILSMKLNPESDAISTGHLSVEQLKYILENSQPKLLANIDELSDKAMAASIGQVHQARALNGELWAIKVQFPDIGPILMDELNTLIRVAEKSPARKYGFDADVYKRDLGDLLKMELNYLVEQKNQLFFLQNMKEFGIHIAELKPEFCSNNILVQQFVPTLTKGEIRDLSEGERKNLAKQLTQFVLKNIFMCPFFYSDLQPANWGVHPVDKKLVLYDFGSTVRVDEKTRLTFIHLVLSCSELISTPYTPFELLVAMGFNEKKLVHLREQIPSVLKKILEPIKNKGSFDVKKWNLSHSLNQILGDGAWWFRTSGPIWFLMAMRLIQGWAHALHLLDVTVPVQSLFIDICQNKFDEAQNITISPTSSFESGLGFDQMAKLLNVLIMERGQLKVKLELPISVVDELEEYIDEEVQKKIAQNGIDLNQIKTRVQRSGYQPQEMFFTEYNIRSIRVWLS